MGTINTQPIYVSSKIAFVSEEEFRKLPKKWLWPASIDLVSHNTKLSQQGYSGQAYNCNIWGLTANSSDEFNFMHLYSDNLVEEEQENPYWFFSKSNLLNTLTAQLHDLSEQGTKNVSGLLLAGAIWSDSSIKLKDLFLEFAKSRNIPLSIIWGQNNGCSEAYYSTDHDVWVINAGNDEGHDILDENELHDNFEIVEIADGDELVFNPEIMVDEQGDFTGIRRK